jgi:uncharacterized Zn-binding protein involved in type VI secretion
MTQFTIITHSGAVCRCRETIDLMKILTSAAWVGVLSLLLVGCGRTGEQQVADVDEVLVRTAVATQGQVELSEVGAEVSGPPSCTSTQQDSAVDVSCTGTTVDGRPVAVSGTATSLEGGNAPKGSFVGTVAGQQVFSLPCLGC